MTVLKSVWEWWKRVARKIGEFQSRLILVIIYFTIMAPVGILMRLFGDPLLIKDKEPKWAIKNEVPPTLENLRRQF